MAVVPGSPFDTAALLIAIVQSSDDAILSMDLNGIITTWNAAAERMYGYSRDEAVGQSIRLIVPADRQGEETTVLDRIKRGEKVEHFETIRCRKNGIRVPVSLTVSPIHGPSGAIVGASKIARDISERREAEDAAQRSGQRSAFLVQMAEALAKALDYEQTLKIIAQQAVPDIADWCAIDVVHEDGSIGRLAVAHVDPAKVELAIEVRHRYEDPGSPYSVPYVIRTGTPAIVSEITDDMSRAAARGDAERVRLFRSLGLVSYICVPMIASGRTSGALTFAMAESGRQYTERDLEFAEDVASRAAMAVENARAYAELLKANRLKDEFLATLSHELRTPLNAILGYARMLRGGMLQAEKVPAAIATIERNATSLTQMVEDILDVSRIVSGKIRLNVQPVELPVVIQNAIATVQPAADAKRIRIETIIDPRHAAVSGDPDRLEQVVWNLLSNAVKFTQKGGRVQIRLERTDSSLELSVSDTGIGIAAEFLPHIFERFRQADSGTTRQHGGLGLGLAIVRSLVDMHGGTIHVASAGPGEGATFRVRLPLMIVHPHAAASGRDVHAPPEAAAPAERPNLAEIHVLAVDDDGDALRLLRDILEASGAVVTTATSAAAALDLLARIRPDVLVADLGMSAMDGYELITRIRRADDAALRAIPAAALSAYARTQDRARSLDVGFEMHLSKPIDPLELVAAVRALARRNHGTT